MKKVTLGQVCHFKCNGDTLAGNNRSQLFISVVVLFISLMLQFLVQGTSAAYMCKCAIQ